MKHWHENKRAGLTTDRMLGNTNTHQAVADLVVEHCVDWSQVDADTRFLEPAVGMGSFYRALADRLLARGYDPARVFGHQLVGVDVDAEALQRCRAMISARYGTQAAEQARLHHTDFWGAYWPDTTFDWIITNPPYISAKRTVPPAGGDKEAWVANTVARLQYAPSPRSDLYALFHTKALEMLAPSGRCVFLCADSWIDSDFGATLKSMVLNGPWVLERVINSQITPFFRDDTNAIITTIRRLHPGENRPNTKVENWRDQQWGKGPQTQTTTHTPDQLAAALNGDAPNKRNAFLLFAQEHAWTEHAFSQHPGAFVRVQDAFDLRTSSVGAAHFPKDKHGRGQGGDTPVFWQLQARTNRKPDYRTFVPSADLPLWVDGTTTGPTGKPLPMHAHAIFLSTIVDRFPLVFYTDRAAVHVNKYLALFAKNTDIPLWASAAALHSIPAVLSLEQSTKEGTRKTLRKGEFGLAKEMSKADIAHIRIPHPESLIALEGHVRSYQNRVLYNLEDALRDTDYWETQVALSHALGYADQLLAMTKMAVFLYVLRMRHLKKLADFDAWYAQEHGQRLEAIPLL